MASTATFAHRATSTPHGTKRGPDNTLANDERLAKRFDLLHLENGSRLYLPVASSSLNTSAPTPNPNPTTTPQPTLLPSTRRLSRLAQTPGTTSTPTPAPVPDDMAIDDTPHRVYLTSLDSDSDSEGEGPVYLPEIERHLARIPAHVLRASNRMPPQIMPRVIDTEPAGKELVLFREAPESVGGGGEGVRRAILDARRRAREKREVEGPARMGDEAGEMDVEDSGALADDEAMDMDVDMD